MKKLLLNDEDFNLWFLVVQTRHAILMARNKELEQFNTSNAVTAILFCIKVLGDEATPANISRLYFRKPHTTSETINRMERNGIVIRVKDLRRKNMLRVVLTEKGEEIYRKSVKRESIHNIMSCLSKKERLQIWPILEKLRDRALKELGIKQKVTFPPRPNKKETANLR